MDKGFWQRLVGVSKLDGTVKGTRSTFFLLGLAVIGIVFMFVSADPERDRSPALSPPDIDAPAIFSSRSDYRERLEHDLADRLGRMKGVEEVSVLITLESGPVFEYEQNRETTERTTTEADGAGGQREVTETTARTQAVMTRDDGGEQALVMQEKQPEIRGVLVIARGAESPLVKEQLTLAVEAALNLKAHRIRVLPMD